MKRLVAILISISLLLSFAVNGFAYALRAPRDDGNNGLKTKNDIYFEDFTSYEEGTVPKGMKVTQSEANTVSVVPYQTPDSPKKNVLKFNDTSTTIGGAIIEFEVPKTDEPITFEMRIKHVKTSQPGYGFIMNFQDAAGTNAFRIIRYNSDNSPYTYVSYSGNDKNFTSNNNNALTHNDTWFTIKVRIDNELKQTGVIIENEQIDSPTVLNSARYPNIFPDPDNKRVMGYKLPWLSEEIEGVTKIQMIAYTGSTGEHYIDYMKFTKGVPEILPERKRAESKETEIIADPELKLYPDIVNFVFKDEIIYMGSPVIISEGRAMADAESFGRLYGMKLVSENGSYKLQSDENSLSFNENSKAFSLNGKDYSADTAPTVKNGVIYIPIKSFATAMGNTVTWSEAPRCVTVK